MNQPTQPSTSPGLTRFVPGVMLLKGFKAASLRTELVAAVTVFSILVPSAMAYGDLAGVAPVAGLYVAIGSMLMYALFGTSRQLILGPEATTAMLTAAAVAPMAAGDPVRYAALAAALAGWSGCSRSSGASCAWALSPTSCPGRSWSATSPALR